MKLVIALAAVFTLGLSSARAGAAPIVVFETSFDGAMPSEFSPGTALLEGVQGYAGLGPAGNQFAGNFLRSQTANVVTLLLTGLPSHDTISLEFLFAAIDSLDGTGVFPQGDFFTIVFDGVTLFSESFANATTDQTQSYVAPPGVELARRMDLGFSGPGGFYTDSAYNLGADSRFDTFAHTGPNAKIDFFMFGEGLQSLDDESWAMEYLRVKVDTRHTVPEPGMAALLLAGAVGALARRRRPRIPRGSADGR